MYTDNLKKKKTCMYFSE